MYKLLSIVMSGKRHPYSPPVSPISDGSPYDESGYITQVSPDVSSTSPVFTPVSTPDASPVNTPPSTNSRSGPPQAPGKRRPGEAAWDPDRPAMPVLGRGTYCHVYDSQDGRVIKVITHNADTRSRRQAFIARARDLDSVLSGASLPYVPMEEMNLAHLWFSQEKVDLLSQCDNQERIRLTCRSVIESVLKAWQTVGYFIVDIRPDNLTPDGAIVDLIDDMGSENAQEFATRLNAEDLVKSFGFKPEDIQEITDLAKTLAAQSADEALKEAYTKFACIFVQHGRTSEPLSDSEDELWLSDFEKTEAHIRWTL